MVWSQLAVPGDAPRFDDADDDGEEDEDGDMHPIWFQARVNVCVSDF